MAAKDDKSSFTPSQIADGQGDKDLADHVESELKSQQQENEEELRKMLKETESEIVVLRQVLDAKLKRVQELKKQLSITPWKVFREDLEHGLQSIQKNNVYQKTSQTLGSWGASMSKTLENVKNNPTVKNIEEKVGNTFSSVKSKVVGSSSFIESSSLINSEEPADVKKEPATGNGKQ